MADRQLRPSRFAAGHTVGRTAIHPAVSANFGCTAPPPVSSPQSLVNAAPQSTNKLALASFILVVTLGPMAAPVGLPLALAAQRQSARSGQRGAGLAKAAVFIGLAYVALAATVLALHLLVGS